jgi:hypothetical protein
MVLGKTPTIGVIFDLPSFSLYTTFNDSVQQKKGVSKIVLIVRYRPRNVALDIIMNVSIRLQLLLDVFPFPVSSAKLIRNFWCNRRYEANRLPHFVYSSVFLMLCQYY